MGTICCENNEHDEEQYLRLKTTYSTVDGHTGMEFKGNTMVKVTKESEARNYQRIFDEGAEESLVKLRPFLVDFYTAVENQNLPGKHKWKITIGNMLHGRKYASKLDIKLGTSTCSTSILDDPEKLRKRLILDKETTSHTLGFNIGGMSLKDPINGQPRDEGKLGLEDSCKDRADSLERMKHFFKY